VLQELVKKVKAIDRVAEWEDLQKSKETAGAAPRGSTGQVAKPAAKAVASKPLASSTLKLVYFNITARAEAIRWALHIGGIKFEDNRVTFPQWASGAKQNAPFGTAPVLEVDGEKLTQSMAILLYVGEKTGLAPSDAWGQSKVMEALALQEDIYPTLASINGKTTPDATKEALKVKLATVAAPGYFANLDKLLQRSTSGYLYGDGLSVADLPNAVLVELLSHFLPAEVAPSAKVSEWLQKVVSHPKIQEWKSLPHPEAA